MRRKRVAVGLLLIAVLVIGAGVVWRARSKSASSGAVNPYVPIPVRQGQLSTDIYATGNVQALKTTNVYAPKGGVVAETLVGHGDVVSAGEVLVRLEPNEADVQQAEADVRQKRENLAAATEKLAKIRGLHEKGAATASELRSAESDVAQAREALEISQLKLDKLVTRKGEGEVRAPVGGVVSTLNAVAGQSMASGAVAAVITEIADLVVRVTVDEYDVGTIQVGQPAEVTFDALGNQVFTGVVSFIGRIGQTRQGVVVYDVDIRLDDTFGRVLPGMSAEASIVANRVENALIVPNAALQSMGGRTFVMIYKSDGTVEMRPVTVGLSADSGTQIVEGVSLGEMVAVANPRAVPSSSRGSSWQNILNNLRGRTSQSQQRVVVTSPGVVSMPAAGVAAPAVPMTGGGPGGGPTFGR